MENIGDKRYWFKVGLIVAVIVIVLLLLFRVVLLTAAGSFLVVEDELREASAIVVLQGSTPERILAAVDLYHQGWGDLIILGNNLTNPAVADLRALQVFIPLGMEIEREIAIELGVDPRHIVILPGEVNSTSAEAAETGRYISGHDMDRIIVITSKYHTRRSKILFNRHIGDTEVIVHPTGYDTFAPDKWWQNRNHAKNLFMEYIKLATMGII